MVISKYKTAKHFEVTITDDSLAVTRRQAQIDAEAALDGIYVLRTPVPREGRGEQCLAGAAGIRPRPVRGYLAGLGLLMVLRLDTVLQPSRRSACSMKLSRTHSAAACAPSSATSCGLAGNARILR
jgi:hypothetical protein